jgi:hypothetical protein
MKYERVNKNSPAQQRKKLARPFYIAANVVDERGKPKPFRKKDYAEQALSTHEAR